MAPTPHGPPETDDAVLERFVDAVESLLREGDAVAPVSATAATSEDASVLRARARRAQHRAASLRDRAARCTGPDRAARHPSGATVHRAVGLLMLTFGVDAVRATACLTRLARRHRVAPEDLAARLLDAGGPAVGAVSVELDEAASGTDPDILRHALAYIHRHAGEPIAVAEIAAAAAISTRELQRLFRRHRDTTPLAYLRRTRLEGAHLELRAADPHRGDTVASIASRWGFGHPGRFSMAYQECYDQPPSHTLRTAGPAAPAPAQRPGP